LLGEKRKVDDVRVLSNIQFPASHPLKQKEKIALSAAGQAKKKNKEVKKIYIIWGGPHHHHHGHYNHNQNYTHN